MIWDHHCIYRKTVKLFKFIKNVKNFGVAKLWQCAEKHQMKYSEELLELINSYRNNLKYSYTVFSFKLPTKEQLM